ncbi:MAG TPA: cytidine deaminase [Bacteroidales bacterium]|nr:cytidine deaminase [Bacteroidales bacterium]
MIQRDIYSSYYEYNSLDELPENDKTLVQKAMKACKNAYAPYSGFSVGAALELSNNVIIEGSNQENSAYPSGLCAERVALFAAGSSYPEIPATSLAIAAFSNGSYTSTPVKPCGSCLQVLAETEQRYNTEVRVILYGEQSIYLLEGVKNLLPMAFIKSEFFVKRG